MPLLHVFTSTRLPDAGAAKAMLQRLSARLAERLHKPESYVMTCLTETRHMTFGGSDEPACYVELKNIGRFTPALTEALSAEVCTALSEALHVPKARIYIEFTNAEAHLWGHDGGTFA